MSCLYKGGPPPNCVAVDAMLGWLARWLRIIGVDARYSLASDEELASTRCLLVTRDKELFKRRKGPAVLLLTDDHVEWISALLRILEVEPFKETRCPKCNARLVEAPCPEVESIMGHPVRSSKCWRCPSCGSAYWEGSHWRGIRKVVDEALRRRVVCAEA